MLRTPDDRARNHVRKQAAWRETLQRTVAAFSSAYGGCDCARVRGLVPKKRADGRRVSGRYCLNQMNRQCPVHRKTADKGKAEAHALILEMLPSAVVYSEVPIKTLECEGTAFEGSQFVSFDLSLDMLVQCCTGVFFAVEIHGREHLLEHVAARDAKKSEYMHDMHVPLIVLWLERVGNTQIVPTAKWREQLRAAQQALGNAVN